MTSENHLNNSDKEVDEVDAALSDLEITLEGGKTSTILVGWIFLPTNLLWIDAYYLFVGLGSHEVFGGCREIFNALENSDTDFSETFKTNMVLVSSASNK